MMLKVNTIEQYKVLKFIEENFYMDAITVNMVDPCTLKVTDAAGDTALFKLNPDGTVTCE